MNHKKLSIYTLLVVVLALLLAGCGLLGDGAEDVEDEVDEVVDVTDPADEDVEEPEVAEADLESLEILLLESFPVQVNAIASGTLPNACWTLQEPTPRLEGNTFVINLTRRRLPDEVCTQAVVPFDKVIPLDVQGLPAGTYTVIANDISESFSLEADNVVPEDEPTPATGIDDSGGISGVVWHDLCAVAGGEGGEPLLPSDGCVALEGDLYVANGLLEVDEPGLAGVQVRLGSGACPGVEELTTEITDAEGEFSFADLAPGAYCIYVDALDDVNTDILIPGTWTAPEVSDQGVIQADVTVAGEEVTTDVNFGWDYEGLPVPEEVDTIDEGDAAEDTCIDSASFVADVTVLDNEILPPGFVFTKTWRLSNDGTCTWTDNYELAFVGGDQLGAPDAVPLQQTVEPNETADLSVQFIAPNEIGTFRSNWMLRNDEGELFGIPDVEVFWVQIQVTIAEVPEPGSVISGIVFSDLCVVDAQGEVIDGECVETDDDELIADGEFNLSEPRLEGITVSRAEGACPATEEAEVIATTATGEDGRFMFVGVEAGSYCIFVDPEAGDNAELLPGQWTFPDVTEGIIGSTVTIGANEWVSEIIFGWDFEGDLEPFPN
ncbi:MAG: NBR1-Ig-like domain-containing protein [Candidatus Promineifilaceae bacterium]|nr:NBR1-Ig-like domain-containing protein [Candidatus Promineifilaceae bacterium]